MTQGNPTDPPAPSSDIIIGIHIPLGELGLVLFTPSKKHTVVNLDMILFEKNKKTIFIISEKRLKIGDQPDVVMVTEKNFMQGMNEDPQFLASINIKSTRDNADNVNKLVGDVERELNKKHEATISQFEGLKNEYQEF